MNIFEKDWELIDFEPVSIEDAAKAQSKRPQEGHDPYNSSTRLPRVKQADIDAWLKNLCK